jgi:hypothetical protein
MPVLDEHMKKCSTLLISKETQMKAIYTPTQIAKIKVLMTSNVEDEVKQWNTHSILENSLRVS